MTQSEKHKKGVGMNYCTAYQVLKAIDKRLHVDFEDLVLALLQKQKEYIKMLGNEIDSLVPFASTHGWKSENIGKGEKLRKEMKVLDKLISKHIE